MAETYKIVRFYRDRPGYRYTIKRRLTLEEAQAHCRDPQTSSSTAKGKAARERTALHGPWFDGYTRE